MLCLFLTSYAQENGQVRITGKVSDATTGEPLPGVNIVIKDSYVGTVTGLNGQYSIMIQGSGKILTFSFVGYISQNIPVESTRVIDVSLSADLENLEEVVITAQAKGQIGARTQQINSNTIMNVVAPDRLQENPDANAVEAIGRLPGISVLRSGGEGSALVIRGLEPRYSSVTLNGVQMASTSSSGRETNLSSISQYMLQGVEVYKALTADMEANAVAGTVNLRLRETPQGFHYHVMAQGGYNDLNNYFGNYKFQAEVSNRVLKDKLGVSLSLNTERVNRSTQTMSAGYGTNNSSTETLFLLSNADLNNITTIKSRQNAMLTVDYKLLPSTTISLYGMYTYTKDDHERQTKSYNMEGDGGVWFNFLDNPFRNTDIFQSSLSGVTKLKFLEMEIDYGLVYSESNTRDPDSRSWAFDFQKASSDDNTTIPIRQLYPNEVIPLYHDSPDSLHNLYLWDVSKSFGEMTDKNWNTYLNFEIPYRIGQFFKGDLKFGGAYRMKDRLQDYNGGGQLVKNNDNFRILAASEFDWAVRNQGELTAVGLQDYRVDDFLNGKYDFGWNFNMNRMNEITNWWNYTTDTYFLENPDKLTQGVQNYGYRYDIFGSVMNDQDITENYKAGYLMTEINFGKWIMFMPGIRYEFSDGKLFGYDITPPTLAPMMHETLPITGKTAEREDEFWLPMVHLRIKPVKPFYAHFAYTQTLSRPDFGMFSPNQYINTGFAPFSIDIATPYLKPEFWTNYDAQFTLHGNKIGLISVSGFYKTVNNKIWRRNYKRLKGDDIIPPFPDAAVVNVSTWENHDNPIYLKGLEFEVQTSFWYLPKPFSYFTFYGNYTLTSSQTQYSQSRIENIIPVGGGRPVPTRIDTVYTGSMLYQPKHIANASLGFNRKGLNIWLSFQYNGLISTSKDPQLKERDGLKEAFNRWDLQITQKLPKKLKGLELMANFANLNDITETSRYYGDPRPTYLENYGLTVDLGVRYRF